MYGANIFCSVCFHILFRVVFLCPGVLNLYVVNPNDTAFSHYFALHLYPSKPRVRKLWLEGQRLPPSVFVNKVLLEHSHWSTTVLSVVAFTLQQQAGSCNRDRQACKDENISSLVHYRKFADPRSMCSSSSYLYSPTHSSRFLWPYLNKLNM